MNSREFRYEILNTRARNFRERNFSAPTISIQLLRGPSCLQGLRSSPRLTTESEVPLLLRECLRTDSDLIIAICLSGPILGRCITKLWKRGYQEALKT